MDEIIYILLAVAWVVYSIYNANQKKKQKELEAQAAKEQADEFDTPDESESPKRSVFEEIFDEADFLEPDDAREKAAYEIVSQKGFPKPEIPLKEPEKKYDLASERITMREESEKVATEKKEPWVTPESFDLRKAVIYSAILERPHK
jgi:hypothetical protein